MILFLADNIDQLDLALDQLSLRDRNFDRFALMLIDNVVELTLHRYALDRANENGLWVKLGQPKYDQDLIDHATGQRFDAKIKCARTIGLIDDSTADCILNLHSYRNTSYHRGLRHEGILHDLAILYFQKACLLLKAYKPRFWSWSSNDSYPHRARKYLGEPTGLSPEKTFTFAYDRLLEVAAPMGGRLIESLSAEMQSTIDTMDHALDFLVENSRDDFSREHNIAELQAWKFVHSEKAREFAIAKGYTPPNILLFVEWLTTNYQFPIRGDPVPSWQARQQSLADEADSDIALKKYCDFTRQTEELRTTIMEAAAGLEDMIQNETDRRRGK